MEQSSPTPPPGGPRRPSKGVVAAVLFGIVLVASLVAYGVATSLLGG